MFLLDKFNLLLEFLKVFYILYCLAHAKMHLRSEVDKKDIDVGILVLL
jgi:hypothetical protein